MTITENIAIGSRFIPACAGNSPGPPHHGLATTVHPRVCGEQSLTKPSADLTNGSSPRVRGTVNFLACGVTPARFIPACAGNRVEETVTASDSPVHPRVCGEQSGVRSPRSESVGSSPRVRGTERSPPSTAAVERFIPACAGNSSCSRGRECSHSVHPRVCGEQGCWRYPAAQCHGSSPRVRGTALPRRARSRITRFIPACAGNSLWGFDGEPFSTVHPRVCGEQSRWQPHVLVICGSSPRVRGTDHHAEPSLSHRRFIPACAGNSLCISLRVRPNAGSSPRVRGTEQHLRTRAVVGRFIPACAGNSTPMLDGAGIPPVHPRVCGEQHGSAIAERLVRGSSPRVRGTGLSPRRDVTTRRFIPACAGNRTCCAGCWRHLSVHPRVCGEQINHSTERWQVSGSSPRVRGTGRGRQFCGPARRFIPACAGNR